LFETDVADVFISVFLLVNCTSLHGQD